MFEITKTTLNFFDKLGRFFSDNTNPVTGVDVVYDIPYAGIDDPERSLDIYLPEGVGPHPVMVYFHGGAWTVSDKRTYGRVSKLFAKRGYLVVNANYRLLPTHRHPSQLQDASAAIRWTYDHIAEYDGDPSQLFLSGDSAGAHLASWYAAATRKPSLFDEVGVTTPIDGDAIRALVLFYGVYNMFSLKASAPSIGGDAFFKKFLGDDEATQRKHAATASPLFHVDADLPPVLLIAGETDMIFAQSVEMAQMLESKGASVETFFMDAATYPDAGHAFLNFYTRKSFDVALGKATSFLDSHADKGVGGVVIPFRTPARAATQSLFAAIER